MQNDLLASLAHIPDVDLVARMKTLIAREREATAELVAHLAELDTRELYLREGYGSLFVYCRDALGLSEWEAYNRMEVARSVRRFPLILEMLADGSLSLTAARLLGPHLTADNHREVLADACGKRKADILVMVARLSPKPDVAFSVRQIRTPQSQPSTVPGPPASEARADLTSQPISSATPAARDITTSAPTVDASILGVARHASPVPSACVAPLSPGRYKLQITISGETLERLRLAKDMLGHAIPSGDDAAVVDRALVALLADLAKKKFADTPAPRRPRAGNRERGRSAPPEAVVRSDEAVAPTDGATVPSGQGAVRTASSPTIRPAAARRPSAAVKRVVWLRDLGRCAFVGAGGHRCNERRFVEFHHVDPYALGGEATMDGIQLRCRRHNDYEGRMYFGKRRRSHELVPEQVGLSERHSTS